MSKVGIILNNIGTPLSPETKDVSAYLKEFLMDPNVIGLPYPFRFLLVHGLIAPFRSRSSGAKYKSIWSQQGSPLLVHTENLRKKLQQELGPEFSVKIGMRYGKPSIEEAIKELESENIRKVIFAPLYPQYAEATTGSNTTHYKKLTRQQQFNTKFLESFYHRDFFLNPLSEVLKKHFPDNQKPQFVLFSYHGLPESQIKEVHGCLENPHCCQRKEACDLNCYKAQCHKTSEGLAKKLDLEHGTWATSFQSRLGPSKWIGPATTHEVQRLAKEGIKNLFVATPAFVTDCLETLEEINIELRQEFLSLGGETFTLAPCLNDHETWVKDLCRKFKTIRF